MPDNSERTALLAGASGLVGGFCLQRLLADPAYASVTALVRRLLPIEAPGFDQRIVDFDQLVGPSDIPSATDIYCCLGTTMRSAGSRQAFRRVDFDYVRNLAELAVANGSRRFLLVSASGAFPNSRIFYNRVKGESEERVAELPFDAVHIFRPSLLLGARVENRPGERLAQALLRPMGPLFLGPLRRYRPIPADTVAAAMIHAAFMGANGINTFESNQIWDLAAAAAHTTRQPPPPRCRA